MHRTVLLDESVELLQVKPAGRYVDGTLGMGGHSEAILKKLGPQGRLLSCDVDASAIEKAKPRLQPFGDRTITRLANFRGLQSVLRELGWESVDGILVDLGVSSVQLDDSDRGLSFFSDLPLDMRLDRSQPRTALTVLQQMDERELADLLFEFGEPRHARRLSRAIVADVQSGKLHTAKELSGLCERIIGRHGKTHPATRVFLALRCAVNDELGALKDLLAVAPRLLAPHGRLAVISFHSLEDRLVKHRFRELGAAADAEPEFRVITKKPIVPSDVEQRDNPRSRSAKLRVLEKVA